MTTTDTRATADAGHGGTVRQGVDYLPMEQDTYTYARMYAARGWSLVALHWITAAGQCSCGTVGCKSAGKHPRGKEWQQRSESPERWLRGDGTVLNIGIRTGEVSGFWVLDYDPADADDAGRALFDELTAVGHMRPPHVRTGGGGYHWRFRMPGFPVRNRQSAGGGGGRTHRLPAGWDVRGEGGQVVAPPSVSAKGAYVELSDAAAYEAPAWLLELIRPVERDAPPNHTVSTALPTSLRPEVGGPEGGAEVGRVEGSSHSAEQVQAYANRALSAELSEYESTADGRRGEPAFAFACNLVEIANLARWPLEAVYPYFEASSLRAGANAGGGGYAPHELPGQWQRAIEHVGGRARVMPPGPEVVPGFSLAGAAAPADWRPVDPGTGSDGAAAADGVTRVTATTPGPDLPVDPFERRVRDSMVRRLADLEAKRRIEAAAAGDAASRLAAMRAEIIDAKALKLRPRLRPIVTGLLYRNTLARINGASGDGKSLITLDLAAAVAAGAPWAGRPTHAGPVVMLVAEGEEGVGGRVEAWETHHEREFPSGVLFLPRPVQVMSEEWPILTATLTEIGPALVIGDTQARMTSGVNEIDNTELGEVVERLDGLRVATGACVLLVHHYGTRGERGRGGTAITGALQTELGVKRTGRVIEVSNPKSKDDAEMKPILFDLLSVPVAGPVDGNGFTEPGRTGAVAVYRGEGATGEESQQAKLDAGQRRARALWRIIVDEFNPGDGGTRADIKAHFFDLGEIASMKPDSRRQAWQRAWNTLIGLGLVAKHIKGARFKIVEVADQAPAGVLTANPDLAGGGVGSLNHNWELWTDDLESKAPKDA